MAFSHVLRMKPFLNHRLFCSITQSDSALHKQKIQSALSLLKSNNHNNNPAEQILYFCLSNTISDLPPPLPSSTIHSFLHELNTQPALMSSFLEELKAQPDFRKERMFSYIITVYGQAGMFNLAKKTFQEMPAMGIAPSVESLNALLGAALHTSKRLLEANKIFTDYPTIYCITRNTETYNLYLKAWVGDKSKSIQLISTALTVMRKENYKPDETIYGTILAGLSEATPDQAVEVIEFIAYNIYSIQNIDIYNLGIQILCKFKKTAQAKKLLEKINIRGMDPNSVTYQHLISGFTSEGNVEEVKRLAQDMHQNGIELNRDYYEFLTDCPSRDGDDETALQNKGNVETAASRYESFSKYISQIEDPEVAYRACEDCMEEEWFPGFLHSDPATLESLVERLLVDSRHGEVRELLGRMEKVGLKPSVDIYDIVIQKLYDLNESDDAEEFCHLVSKRGVKLNVDTYWRVIEDLSSKDQTYEMKRLFNDMIKKGVEPDQRICEQLIQDLCEVQDDYDDAFLVCKECMSMPWFPNFVSTNRKLKDIILGLLDNSLFGVADELLDIMKEHKSSQLSEIYSTILDKNCERGEGDRAVYFYGKASALDLNLNEDTYFWLVDLFCRDRRLKSLEEVLSDMSKKGVEIDCANYENIVECLCDSDCVDKALRVTYECISKKWFADFLEDRSAITDYTSAIEALVDQLKKESRFEEVWKLLEEMKKNGLQPNLKFFFQ